MRKLLYILPVLLILGLAACENYVDNYSHREENCRFY